MAKTEIYTDDIDGSSGAKTVQFSIEGVNYELDLAKKNRASLEKVLRPYIDAARPSVPATRRSLARATPVKRATSRRTKADPTIDLRAVRTWAAEAGIAVSDRGRISKAVMDEYLAAQR